MESDFKIYPASCSPKDYWGQVKRTVSGKAVSEDQIRMIVTTIERELSLDQPGENHLLDMACGNGALSSLVFPRLQTFLGVDFSEVLISVARRDFQKPPDFQFLVADVQDYLRDEPDPCRFNKVLCYGAFSYFPNAVKLLELIRQRFTAVEKIFVGNLPDRTRAEQFYTTPLPEISEMIDPNSKIGIWRTQGEFEETARKAGWVCRFTRMPDEFYAHHYRYDATLTRCQS